MKRVSVFLVIVFMMSIVVTGCGGGTSDKIGASNPGSGKVKLGDGKEINYGTAKQGKSLPLPANYPVEVLPLLDDAVITFVNTNDSTKGVGVYYETNQSLDETVGFYEKVMESGQITTQANEGNMLMMIGSKDSYSVTINIVHQPKAKVSVLLDITPAYN